MKIEPVDSGPSKDDFPDEFEGSSVAVAEPPKKAKAAPVKAVEKPEPKPNGKHPLKDADEVIDPGQEEDDEIEIDAEPAKKVSAPKREPAKSDEKEGSKKKAEAKPEADEEVVEEDDSGFSKELLNRASDYGFDEAEAKAFKTPEALENVLDIQERRFIAQSRKAQEGQAKPEEKAQEVKPKVEAKPAIQAQADDEIPDLPDGEFDDRLTQGHRALRQTVIQQRTQIKQLGEMVENLVRHALTRQAAEEDKAHDGWLDSLNGPFKDVFGGKAGDRRNTKSEAFQNAAKVYQAKQFLKKLYLDNGRQVDDAEIGKRALAAEFGDLTRLHVTQELSEKAHSRARSFGVRPTNRYGDANRRVESETRKTFRAIRDKAGESDSALEPE